MRVPPSMIVMGLLTAIPFGMGIKQTLHKAPDDDRELEESMDPDLASERRQMERAAQYERELEQERLATEKEKAKARALHQMLFGHEPATLGPALSGFAWGQAGGDTPHMDGVVVTPTNGVHGLVSLSVRFFDDCTDFGSDLDKRWGAQAGEDLKEHWIGQDGVRATFDPTGCTLAFDKNATVDAWIGHGDASLVPIDWVGKSSNIIKTKLGPTVDADETQAQWFQSGVEGSTGATNVNAIIEGNRITSITAAVTADSKTREAISGRLTKLFGAPKEYPESGADLAWGSHPHVELRVSGNLVEITATK